MGMASTQLGMGDWRPQKKKSLACRTRYPIQLAFALTVHKAQGQTLQCVEVDLFVFWPRPYGSCCRCVNKEGSSVVNLKAAQLKHTDAVYAFYDEEQKEPNENLDST